MKTLPASLVLILLSAACESSDPQPVQRIDFSIGGASYYSFSLDASGHLSGGGHYPDHSDTVYNFISMTIDPVTTMRLMSRARELFSFNYNERTNRHLSLTINTQGGENYISWGSLSTEVDPRVVNLHNDLWALLIIP